MRTRTIATKPWTAPAAVLRRIARKALRSAPPAERLSLTLEHTPRHAILSGRVAEGVLIEALQARVVGAVPARTITFPQEPSSSFSFELDLADLYDQLGAPSGSYDFYLTVRRKSGSEPQRWRLGTFLETDRDRAVQAVPVAGTSAWLHVTGLGNVSLHFSDEQIRRTKVTPERLRTRADGVTFRMRIETYSRPATAMVGTWVARQSNVRHEFPVTVTELVEDRRRNYGLYSYRVEGTLSPADFVNDLAADDDIFDPHVEMTVDGIDEPVKAAIKRGPRLRSSLRDVVVPRGTERQLLVPYFTFRVQRLAFWSETFAARDYQLMRRLRLVSWTFFLIRPFLGIWLIGEAPYKAQDNGFQFFRWLREHHPRRRAYYVIEADSPDRARVEPLGHMLLRHSRRHIWYSLLASRFVGSHHAEYLFASRSNSIARRSSGLRVFLQHGVTAAKNVTLNYGRRFMFESPPDVFCVNSELERDIVVQELEYPPSQVPITGFARFDTLLAADTEVQRRILVMPTWRDSINSRENFLASEFLAHWQRFLRHPDLRRVAEANQMTVELVLHPNMRHHAAMFDIDGILVRSPGEDVQGLIKSSAVLITDYSSVAWDFSFLERPVLYFQFDRAGFIGNRQPFIDFATQLPGDIASTADHLVTLLEKRITDGLSMPEEYRLRSRAFLTHRDQHNCERIFDVVRRADGFRTRATRVRNTRWMRNAYQSFRTSPTYQPVMTWLYRFAKLLPRQPLIVFESDRGLSYGGSPRALYERLLERDHKLKISFVNNSPMRLPDRTTRKVFRMSPRYYWQLGRAKYWVFNQNSADQFVPSRRTYFLQTWHGTPLKKMQNDVPVMYGRADDYHKHAQMLVDYWTSLVSPSPYATAAFRSAFGFTGEVLETGYPCNDVFFKPDVDDRTRVIRQRLGIVGDRRVVLYAPTFRDDMRKGKNWTAEMALDLERFREVLGRDAVLLVRFHPLVRFKFASQLDDVVIDVSRYPDTQDLLLASDVLITDYSSIMFDFAHTGRQTLFFTYDIETYRDKLRGFYFDFENEAPGPLLSTSDEVIDALTRLPKIEAEYAARRKEFIQRFGPLDDGHASDRVLDAMLGPQAARRT